MLSQYSTLSAHRSLWSCIASIMPSHKIFSEPPCSIQLFYYLSSHPLRFSFVLCCLADLLFYGNLVSSMVSSQLASPVSRLVSSRPNSSHLVPSRLVSRLLSSHRLSGHITLPPPPPPPFRLPWYQPIASHLGFSRLCSSRLVFRHTYSHLVFRVVSFRMYVSSLRPQNSPISCLMSQISSL